MLRKVRFGSPEEYYPHHGTFADLNDAANDGCHICKRLLLQFVESGINDSEALLHRIIEYMIFDDDDSDRDSERVLIRFEIHTSNDPDEERDSIEAFLELVAVPPSEGTTAWSQMYRLQC